MFDNWPWWAIAITVFAVFYGAYLLKGWRDGLRQKEQAERIRLDDEWEAFRAAKKKRDESNMAYHESRINMMKGEASRLSTKWHMVSMIMDLVVGIMFLLGAWGFDFPALGFGALLVPARWWGVDMGFNFSMNLPLTYTGKTSSVDKALSGNGKYLLIIKTVVTAIAFLCAWLFAEKI